MGKFRIFLVLIGMVSTLLAGAQREHFVYLQTEDQTPFYIKVQGKTVSSTAAGYLIIGQLKDSVYPVKLGILGVDEVQDYGLKVEGRNAGYLVKKLGDRGWGLVDLQTNAEQLSMQWSSAIAAEAARQQFMEAEQKRMADSTAAAAAAAKNNAKKDSAIGTAATATGTAAVVAGAIVAATDSTAKGSVSAKPDSTERIVSEPKTEQQRYADSIAAVIAEKEKELKALQAMLAGSAGVAVAAGKSEDSAKNEKKESNTTVGDTKKNATGTTVAAAAGAGAVVGAVVDGATKKDNKADSTVTHKEKAAVTDTTGKSPVFLAIAFEPEKDSTVSIDTAKKTATSADTTVAVAQVAAAVVAVPAADSAKVKTDTSMVVADTAVHVVDSSMHQGANKVDSVAVTKIQRQPCSDILGREDVESLMTKSAGITDIDELVTLYKNAFKEKCVSTSNLKKICNSLASDVGKYKVLEAAYPHTLDFYAFGELSSLLKDPYYQSKFKTLIQ